MTFNSLSLLDQAIKDYNNAVSELEKECSAIAEMFEQIRSLHKEGDPTLAEIRELRPRFYHAYFIAAEVIAFQERIKVHSSRVGRR